jgi:hypothetical protein
MLGVKSRHYSANPNSKVIGTIYFMTIMSVCSMSFVEPLHFRRFLGDVRQELMQRLSAALHGTLGSYLRDALQEGGVDAEACLPVSRA